MKRLLERFKLKKDKDNLNEQGSSFVMVLVSVALVMIVVAIMFVMIFLQYKMLRASKQSKDNFYFLEEVLNEMRVGVGNQALTDLKKAYDETVAMVVYYDTTDKKYMSVSDTTASNILNNKYFGYIKGDFQVNETALREMLLSYVQNVHGDEAAGYHTTEGVEVTFDKDDFGCSEIFLNNTKLAGYRITGVTVSRTDDKGNQQSISTDFIITPPEDALNFLASAQSLSDVFSYNVVADYGLEFSQGTNNTCRLTGNVYTGSDMRNNGIYGGTIANYVAASGESYSKKIVNSTAGNIGRETANSSVYSGIYVSGKNNVLNLQSDIISVNGCIVADNGSTIDGSKKSDSSDQTTQSFLVAKNLLTAAGSGDGSASIMLNANFRISDDLEINAPDSQVTLRGSYYGYSYAMDEDNVMKTHLTGTAAGNQLSADRTKRHTNSSAILVNGKNSKLDLSGLDNLVVNGRSYIDLLSAKSSDNDQVVDIETADSVSVKSNQLTYRVQESAPINGDLKSLDTQGVNYVYGAYAGSEGFGTNYVPNYDMIKFFVYQFFEGNGKALFECDTPLTGFQADWNRSSVTREYVWDDIQTYGKDSKFYKDLMDIYLPDTETLSAGRHLYQADDDTIGCNHTGTEVEVTDAFGTSLGDPSKNNTYRIIANEGTLKGKVKVNSTNVNVTISRYGFLTAGKHKLNLIKTTVGGNDYYYFQFYDRDSREQFVLDYSHYLSELSKGKIPGFESAIDNPLGANILNDDVNEVSLLLPDQDKKQYTTSGLGTVIEAGDTEYKLITDQDRKTNASSVAEVNQQYTRLTQLAKAYMTYFPKAEMLITGYGSNIGEPGTMVDIAEHMYEYGDRDVKLGKFFYDTSGDAISPLTNPDCVTIDWEAVADKPASYATGVPLNWYPGGKVWVSDQSIEVNGAGPSGDNKIYGIIISMKDVTLKNVEEFKGIILCAGKLRIEGANTAIYADENMCTTILETDKDNQIRTCFGLKEFDMENSNNVETVSITSIEYTDLVGYDNWIRNGE